MIESKTDFQLPYITADFAGIGGKIRAMPEHFVVDEIPLYEPEDEGQHLYVNITKVGLTTKEVQKELAKLFDLHRNDIGFAGMKDKFARTTQTFSISVGHGPTSIADASIKRIADALPVMVNWARLHKNKLKTGHLLGNRFQIRVTSLNNPAGEASEQATNIVDKLCQSGVPNYFGPQRFGHNGANVERGLEIIRSGERSRNRKDKWLQKFLISSYQSYLCNQYLAKRIEIDVFDSLLQGDIAKKYETGGIFDVEDLTAEAPRYQAKEISFTAPIFGPKMRRAGEAAGELEESILDASDVTIEDFAKVKVEGTRRLGRLLLPDLEIIPVADEPSLDIAFSLPKGAFATTVLREIMKVDLSQHADAEE